MSVTLHPGDFEAWLRVETAIGIEARRLCGESCDRVKRPGAGHCRSCPAGRLAVWQRDALLSLRGLTPGAGLVETQVQP